MHCNALQLTATHCNSRQRTAPNCNTLQQTGDDVGARTAKIYGAAAVTAGADWRSQLAAGQVSMLQCVAVCCSVLQYVAATAGADWRSQLAAGQISRLQCVEVCCRVLQCSAVCSSV